MSRKQLTSAIFFSLSASIIALSGCEGRVCNTLYAPDQANITVQSSGFDPGFYEVEALGELCSVTLPGTTVTCSGTVLNLTLDSGGTAITAINVWEEAPEELDVVIFLDGVELLNETITPTYTESEPNGAGCGFVQFGTAELTLN